MRKLFIGLMTIGLLACAGGTLPPINVQATATQFLTTADALILDYAKLPLCTTGAIVCQDPVLLAKLKDDSLGAFNAVEAAYPIVLANPNGGTAVQTAETLITAAIAALTADLATIPAATRAAIGH